MYFRGALSSRVHPLNHFPKSGASCYVKRDDELGCGVSGSKWRKYASLMPHLIEKKINHLVIIAGPQSNNLLSVLQLAREINLKVTAFLIKPWRLGLQGNFKLSCLFLNEEEIIWIERKDWQEVNAIAEQWIKGLHEPTFLLSEGASVMESMPGALSLAEDILHNEKDLNLNFQHIFIDAGTGFTAAALIKGLNSLNHPAQVHVLLLADQEQQFKDKLHQWLGFIPSNFYCFCPTMAKAFGAVNQTIKKEVRRIAREEGILADPIYTAKLFYEARLRIADKQLKGNILIIHGGGTLAMPHFDY